MIAKNQTAPSKHAAADAMSRIESRTAPKASAAAAARAIAIEAAERAKAAADRSRDTQSSLLRAKEMTDFRLGSERTDIRGWTVYSNDAVLVGSVGSLFVDMHAKVVRYIGVRLIDDRSRSPVGEILVPV